MPSMLFVPLVAVSEGEEWLHALRRLSVEDLLLPLLVQLGLIIVAARLVAALFRRLGQPSVVGEIAAGLLLGPSVLGRFCPGLFQAVFHPTVAEVPAPLFDSLLGWVLTALSQLGLIFLLFLVGLEVDLAHLRWQGRAALSISLAGIVAPFLLGLALAQFLHPRVAADIPALQFSLFLGTALSITAIPVLGRIMLELNITRTRLGTVAMAAAAVDDALGWTLLAAVAALVKGELRLQDTAWTLGCTLAFTLFMVFLARPLLVRWARHALRRHDGELGVNHLTVLLALVFACALVTSRIGIFAVIGAFLLGAVLSGEADFRRAVNRRLRDLVTVFFMPIFFAYTGLRTDVGTLGTAALWGLCGLVTLTAVVGKLGGCGLAAWLSRYSLRESACIGTLMNTRALMALIVINLGKDLGVLPDSVFCMLILMALATTVMTTPALLRLMPGTELEPYIRGSSFVGEKGRKAEPRREGVAG
jgi:Kef-type K+ transport system membrane component KefB